jgi:hypothetical protein
MSRVFNLDGIKALLEAEDPLLVASDGSKVTNQ